MLVFIKESARRKKFSSSIDRDGVIGVPEDVEEVTAFIMEHFGFIRSWILQRANSPLERDRVVSLECL